MEQKKLKSKRDWVGKMIHWELYKWYMNKLESVLANEMYTFLIEKPMNRPVTVRRSDFVLTNKKIT